MKKYLRAIKENLCSICVDSNKNGVCTLSESEICAVEQFLPEIVQIVQSEDEYDKQYELLKNSICKNCRNDDESDNCNLSENANCSLDRYFPQIVEIIQKVDKN